MPAVLLGLIDGPTPLAAAALVLVKDVYVRDMLGDVGGHVPDADMDGADTSAADGASQEQLELPLGMPRPRGT